MNETTVKNRIEAARSIQAATDANRIMDDVDYWRHRRDVLGFEVTVDEILSALEAFADEIYRDA